MTVRKYSTPQAFKEALEQRLRAASKKTESTLHADDSY